METFRSLRKEGVTAGNFRRPLHSFEAPNSNLGLRAEYGMCLLSFSHVASFAYDAPLQWINQSSIQAL
uniref:Uncharacterized protein n=1 Tax=Physcomitrium patens TaxID=3218 RepID=A0A2K1KUP8_PHYPA|nr:hypothetical protein PHYPA_004519 [Physcomitrium patens]